MERWASGDFTHQTAEGTIQLNATALGMIKAIDQTLAIEADDLIHFNKEN